MIKMQNMTINETIGEVEYLIEIGEGDSGRLFHILEFLKNNRPLYNSDKSYLESKLQSSFLVQAEEEIEENPLLPKIQQLMESGNGDLGRLQHIYDMLAGNRPLYNSDQSYLESRLQSFTNISKPGRFKPSEKNQMLEVEPASAQETIVEPVTKSVVRGSMPKGWIAPNNSKELDNISKDIHQEQEKIQQQKIISDEINHHRSKLTKLISHRKEFEQKVQQEKLSLESQIKDEREKIQIQTNLSQEIIDQKEELVKVRNERNDIVKKITADKIDISKELEKQKKQLVQAQLEQEEIEKQVKNKQVLLAKMVEEQKSRLLEQASIAQEIKLKQDELEQTKQYYDEIVSQVNKEKTKFAEAEDLKKQIKIREDDLTKTKEERLKLISVIAKEKKIILKKTQEEKQRLKSQIKLTKQLKKEEKSIDVLKKKREKLQQQIKLKNQKLKDQQQKIKKQIAEKDKKLRSITKSRKIKSGKITKKSKS